MACPAESRRRHGAAHLTDVASRERPSYMVAASEITRARRAIAASVAAVYIDGDQTSVPAPIIEARAAAERAVSLLEDAVMCDGDLPSVSPEYLADRIDREVRSHLRIFTGSGDWPVTVARLLSGVSHLLTLVARAAVPATPHSGTER